MANEEIKKGSASSLPADKKIRGELTGKRIIYMEDYVRTFIKGVEVDEYDEGMVGLLLGEVFEDDGVVYVMVKGATEVGNAAVFKDKISFTAETWPIANGTVSQYFQGMEIVGWYLVSPQINEEDLPVIQEADQESFPEDYKVFFFYNSEADEETFYGKGEDGLQKASGYACFYEKNEAMQLYSSTVRQDVDFIETTLDEGDEPDDDLKDIVREPKEHTPLSVKRHLTLVYAMSMVLIIVVLVIGINAIAKLDEKKESESTPAAPTQTTAEVQDTTADHSDTDVDSTETEGETDPQTEEATTPEETTPEETTPEHTTPEPTTAKNYTEYTVVSGDTLYGIAGKCYGAQKPEYVQKIMEFNNMSGPEIQPGAVIKIPNL